MDRSFHYLLMATQSLFQRSVMAELNGSGLTAGQPKVLDYLIDHEGSDQKTIAACCEIEPATVGSILLGMEEAGLVLRTQRPGNRRSLFVSLTPQGREKARQMAEIFRQVDDRALQALTPQEGEALLTLLTKLYAAQTDRSGEDRHD